MSYIDSVIEQEREIFSQLAKTHGRQVADAQYQSDTNWHPEAITGASIGGSIMPGWGHLIGAGVGALIGQGKGIAARRKKGESLWDAFKATHFDFSGLFKPETSQALMRNAPMLASSAGRGLAAAGYLGKGLQGAQGAQGAVGAAGAGAAMQNAEPQIQSQQGIGGQQLPMMVPSWRGRMGK